jgi:hypothetical protein
MTPLRGVQKYLRGATWLVLLLADTGAALTLRNLATHHALGFAIAAGAVLSLFLRNWFGEYGHAYGGFGVSLALAAAVGLVASFWVWIAVVMGEYGERGAGPAAVARMEELSVEISA